MQINHKAVFAQLIEQLDMGKVPLRFSMPSYFAAAFFLYAGYISALIYAPIYIQFVAAMLAGVSIWFIMLKR